MSGQSSYQSLSAALEGYLNLTREESAAFAVLPASSLPQADLRLSDALRRLPSSVGARIYVPPEPDGVRQRTVKYYVFQYDVSELRVRVERYTAQRARLSSKSVEGDMVNLLTLSEEQDLTFDELLRAAVHDAYAVTSGYAEALPFKACLLNEGVAVTPALDSNFAGATYSAGSYVRVLSAEEYGDGSGPFLGKGKIFLAREDGAAGSDSEAWQEQPEYVDTNGRVTFLIADSDGCRHSAQALERLYHLLQDFIFYSMLAQWYAMCAMPQDMLLMAESASSGRADVLIALDSAREERVENGFL
jgi:hypothetical protein